TIRNIVSGEITATALTERVLDRIGKLDDKLGAYLAIDGEGALAQAAEVDRKSASGQVLGGLIGVPIALKDNLVTRGMMTTAGSKILDGWIPPYDATVVAELRTAGAI